MTQITFGTDGWRGIIADDYTFENVGKVALATAQFFKHHPKIKNGLVIGGDARFGSQDFAECAAHVIASQGITVWLADRIVSTPMVSLGIVKKRAAGGVMITASHNPPKWNGFKIKADFGGSAIPTDIKKVEQHLASLLPRNKAVKKIDIATLKTRGNIRSIDLHSLYYADIRKKIDFASIQKSKMRIAYDVMYGAGMGVMNELLPDVTCIHNEHNPGFHGIPPEPLTKNLSEFITLIRKEKYDIGLVTDGDADRLGAVDENGNFVSTQLLIPLLLKYFFEYRKKRGAVVKTVSVTDILSRMTEKYKLTLFERPVGFKYVTELMITENILIGGEESGGVGTSIHIPERDGIFNCLLLCEYLAIRKMTLGQAVEEIYREFGRVYYDRIDYHTTIEHKIAILKKCKTGLSKIGGYTIRFTETLDGFKFRIDNGWLLIRASGTEPILRFYAEADSEKKMKRLLDAAVAL